MWPCCHFSDLASSNQSTRHTSLSSPMIDTSLSPADGTLNRTDPIPSISETLINRSNSITGKRMFDRVLDKSGKFLYPRYQPMSPVWDKTFIVFNFGIQRFSCSDLLGRRRFVWRRCMDAYFRHCQCRSKKDVVHSDDHGNPFPLYPSLQLARLDEQERRKTLM